MPNISNYLPLGTLLNGGTYRVDRYLASGGFGNTYVVTHVSLQKEYVMKEFFMSGTNDRQPDGTTVTVSNELNRQQFEEQRLKFFKEAQRLSRMDNNHIIRVHNLFEENGTAYYVMDFIDGESLKVRLERQAGPLPESEVRQYIPQLLDALSAIHAHKIWHLDVKPANIMRDRKGKLTLIDFGASKQMTPGKGATSSAVAFTQGYAPQEQIEQNLSKFGPWTDLYALGATIYKLLTNETPPLPSDVDEPDAFRFPAEVSGEMRGLVQQLMQFKAKNRPQNVQEVKSLLAASAEDEVIIVEPPQPDVTEEVTVTKALEPQPEPKPKAQPEPTPKAQPKPGPNSKKPSRSKTKNKKGNTKKVIIACVAGALLAMAAVLMLKNSAPPAPPAPVVANALPAPADQTFTVNGVSFTMVGVGGGTFMMGAASEQDFDAEDDEKPAHLMTVSSFHIGKYEVTQALWQAVMGSNPSRFKGDNLPVEQVSWDDCQEFIRKLNSITGKNFRLPTEAEWEYAARGGNKSKEYKYSGSNNLGDVAWYDDNSGGKTHPVGTKAPNELGLYDMTGNVYEGCQDWYGPDYYSSSPNSNPTGPSSGSDRVARGGSWFHFARCCRVSDRSWCNADDRSHILGLRLAF